MKIIVLKNKRHHFFPLFVHCNSGEHPKNEKHLIIPSYNSIILNSNELPPRLKLRLLYLLFQNIEIQPSFLSLKWRFQIGLFDRIGFKIAKYYGVPKVFSFLINYCSLCHSSKYLNPPTRLYKNVMKLISTTAISDLVSSKPHFLVLIDFQRVYAALWVMKYRPLYNPFSHRCNDTKLSLLHSYCHGKMFRRVKSLSSILIFH